MDNYKSRYLKCTGLIFLINLITIGIMLVGTKLSLDFTIVKMKNKIDVSIDPDGSVFIGIIVTYSLLLILSLIVLLMIDYKVKQYITKVYFIEYIIKDRDKFSEESLKFNLETLEKFKKLNKSKNVSTCELILAVQYLFIFNEYKPEYLVSSNNRKLSKNEKISFYAITSWVSYFDNDFDKALEFVDKLIKIDPTYDNKLIKAIILQKMNMQVEAHKIVCEYEKSKKKFITKFKPGKITHIYHRKLSEPFNKFVLGIYYSNLNEKDKAIDNFKWAIDNSTDKEFINIKSKEYIEKLLSLEA
ncbi:MAG: hypothetical protein ACRDA5_03925 [Clostridium sp.]